MGGAKKSLARTQRFESAGVSWGMAETKACLAVSSGSKVLLLDKHTLQLLHQMEPEEEEAQVRRVEFSRASPHMLGVCYFTGVCVLVDVRSREVVQRLEGADTEIKSVAFSEENRAAFSTREGSVWVWQQEETGEWEIEEILEYSDTDVKTVIWDGGSLISMGYDGEVVVYHRWEDEMCTKWEIHQILKEESTVWDGVLLCAEEGVQHLGVVTQAGYLSIYRKETGSSWEKVFSAQVSCHPILSVCAFSSEHASGFGLVTSRQTLSLFGRDGSLLHQQKVLGEDEEPLDIMYSAEEGSFFVLTTQFKEREHRSILSKIEWC
ncbi:cytosolic iron-sulfur protein assembly protein CIAO1 [Nematocida sp. AWRm77]|nr:cytosolic iron-sulfur protein assembly protein CIAO1 [Nematocida sp. AWRm77]